MDISLDTLDQTIAKIVEDPDAAGLHLFSPEQVQHKLKCPQSNFAFVKGGSSGRNATAAARGHGAVDYY